MKYGVWTISVLCLWNACSYGNLKKYLLRWKVPVDILFYYLKDLNTTNVNVTIDRLNTMLCYISWWEWIKCKQPFCCCLQFFLFVLTYLIFNCFLRAHPSAITNICQPTLLKFLHQFLQLIWFLRTESQKKFQRFYVEESQRAITNLCSPFSQMLKIQLFILFFISTHSCIVGLGIRLGEWG